MGTSDGAMRRRLEAYVDLRHEIKMQTLRLENMTQSVGDVRSPSYEPGKAPSLPGDAVSRKVIALESLARRVSELVEMERTEHDELERMVSRIPNAQQRVVLRMRYFDLMEWRDIAFALYGDRVDYVSDEGGYVARCYRIHTRAVSSMCSTRHRMSA